MKRHDTLDPFTGIVRADGVRVQLNAFASMTLMYSLKVNPLEVLELPAVNVEVVDGPGVAGEQNALDGLPENRGRWRAVQTDVEVDTAGVYEMELECVTAGGKKVHFPSRKEDNETLNIDADLDDA